ncbi:MAG: protein kinase [Deltaproteobacteria bacterium]|nr:protein kinase [Deltaproteobacteria bacterium]
MRETLPKDTVLPGNYVVEGVVGEGQVRTVYAVRNAEGQRLAAHLLHEDLLEDLGEWFENTAILNRTLEHPNLVQTHAVAYLGNRPLVLTELLQGETLAEILVSRTRAMPLDEVARIVKALGSALEHLHGRSPPVVHRALTPENLFLADPDARVKLLEVGSASRTRFPPGRPGYRSPEETAGVENLSAAADVFSLGTLVYELLTGRPAFPGDGPAVLDAIRGGARPRVSDHRDDVDPEVDAVILRAWALSPEARHPSAGVFAEALAVSLQASLSNPARAGRVPDEPTDKVSKPDVGPPVPKKRPAMSPSDEMPTMKFVALGPSGTPVMMALHEGLAPARVAPSSTLAGVAPASVRTPPSGVAPLTPKPPQAAAGPARLAPTTVPRTGSSAGLAIPKAPKVPRNGAVRADEPEPFDDPTEITQKEVPTAPPPAKIEPAAATPAPPPMPSQAASGDSGPRPAAGREEAPPAAQASSEAPTPTPVTPPLVIPSQVTPPAEPREVILVSAAPEVLEASKAAPEPASAPVIAQPVAQAAPRAWPSITDTDDEDLPPRGARSARPGERTEAITIPPPSYLQRPAERSPAVVAAWILANAIVIAGIAHALAWGVALRQPAEVVHTPPTVVQLPAPVCAPCAACPSSAAVTSPSASGPAAPLAAATAAPGAPRPLVGAAARPGLARPGLVARPPLRRAP